MPLHGKAGRDQALLNDTYRLKDLQRKLILWGRNNCDEFPWRSTRNRFHALLAEVMLQRTRAEQVVPVFKEFVVRYPSSKAASSEKPERIRGLLSSLGLKWRAEKIIELIQSIDAAGGILPCNLEDLLKLPGIGSYAASSFLSFHAGVRASIVDSNVVRLWGRVFDFKIDARTRRKRWFLDLADKITPKKGFREFNYAVLDLSRKICRQKPQHSACPITSQCKYYRRLYR